jgi:hypothetical protein
MMGYATILLKPLDSLTNDVGRTQSKSNSMLEGISIVVARPNSTICSVTHHGNFADLGHSRLHRDDNDKPTTFLLPNILVDQS